MKEPNLMPFQNEAFNGDNFIEQEFLKLKHRFDIETAVETGTCLGSTTLFLSNNFKIVHTIEINQSYLKIAKQKFISRSNITAHLGDSSKILRPILSGVDNKTILFLDAHWNQHCPLKDELRQILWSSLRPVIAIHDFQVPGTSLGFDSYGGQPFNIEWIRQELDSIYGAKSYEYYYNSDEQSEGAKRGVVYIMPK